MCTSFKRERDYVSRVARHKKDFKLNMYSGVSLNKSIDLEEKKIMKIISRGSAVLLTPRCCIEIYMLLFEMLHLKEFRNESSLNFDQN